MAVRDSWFLTLVLHCSFVSYCSDFPLCIIVTATYSDSVLSSRSASSTSRLWITPQAWRPAIRSVLSCPDPPLGPRQLRIPDPSTLRNPSFGARWLPLSRLLLRWGWRGGTFGPPEIAVPLGMSVFCPFVPFYMCSIAEGHSGEAFDS